MGRNESAFSSSISIGEKFGNWEIVEFLYKDSKNHVKYYSCKCRCGTLKKFSASEIKMHYMKQCKNCNELDRINEVIGKKFGDWEVKKFVGRTPGFTKQWLCECKCGTQKVLYTGDLRSDRRLSCQNCSRKRKMVRQCTGIISDSSWSDLKYAAQSRNLDCTITKEEAYEIYLKQNGKCALTGLPIFFPKTSRDRNVPYKASLDRIDSSKGYTIENCQWVLKEVNLMKQIYAQDFFIEICKMIAENHQNNQTCSIIKEYKRIKS